MTLMRRFAQHRVFEDSGLSYVLGAAYALAGWSFFADPGVARRTSVGHAVAPYDAAWNGLYLLGALLLLIRLIHGGGDRWEGTGLVVLIGGWCINGAASIAAHGVADIRSYTFFVFAGGCALRLRRLEWS